MPALDDVRVLDLTRLLPGPFCTLLLADFGADVIKVEDTTGGDYMRWMPPLVDEYSAMFHPINRNKRSLTLDLKNPLGREAFLRLAATADVVVESFRPGVMDRLGIGETALREVNPRIVLCSISGYGQDGPFRDRAGHDLNYAAVAGVLMLGGTESVGPAMPGLQVGDLGGGALDAALAIMIALHSRRTHGPRTALRYLDGRRARELDGRARVAALRHAARHRRRARGCSPAGIPATGSTLARTGISRWARSSRSSGVSSSRSIGLAGSCPERSCRRRGGPADDGGGRGRVADTHACAVGGDARRTRRVRRARAGHRRNVRASPGAQPRHAARAGRRTTHCADRVSRSASPARPRLTGVRAPGYGEHTDEVLAEAGYDTEHIAALRAAGAIT